MGRRRFGGGLIRLIWVNVSVSSTPANSSTLVVLDFFSVFLAGLGDFLGTASLSFLLLLKYLVNKDVTTDNLPDFLAFVRSVVEASSEVMFHWT